MQDLMRASFTRLVRFLHRRMDIPRVQSSDFGICSGALQMPQERVQIWMRHLHTSSQSRVKTFNSPTMDRHMQYSVFHTIAFLAFSRFAFSTPAMVPHFHVPQVHVSHFQRPRCAVWVPVVQIAHQSVNSVESQRKISH